MPRYLDHHRTNPDMPAAVVARVKKRLDSGELDEFGERGLNVFIGSEWTYCHTDAPSADAVRQSHQALGVSVELEDIIEVQVMP